MSAVPAPPTATAAVDAGAIRGSRFGFVVSLCDAIEAFSAAATAEDPDAFRHRGADLRHVVERVLYFRYVHDPLLFDAWAAECAGRPLERACAANGVHRVLLSRLAPRTRVGLAWRGRLDDGVRPVAAHVLGFARAIRSRLRPRRRGVSAPVGVLALADHDKFLRHVTPLLNATGLPGAWLTTRGPAFAGDLASRAGDLAVLAPGRGVAWPRWPAPALQPFRWITEQFDALSDVLEATRPACVLVSEGNAPADELLRQAAGAAGVRSVCVQFGWSPIVHAGFRNMSYDAMCVWGERFEQVLAPFNPRQRFVACGNHTVGGPERAPGATAVTFFCQGLSTLIDRAGFDAFLDLARWVAETFPQTPVVVREHPSLILAPGDRARLEGPANLHIEAARHRPLAESLRHSAVSVSIYSSTILDSLAAGVVPVIFNVTSLPHYAPDIAAEGLGIEVRSTAAAQASLSELLRDRGRLAQVQARIAAARPAYFASVGTTAVESIAAVVRDAAATGGVRR